LARKINKDFLYFPFMPHRDIHAGGLIHNYFDNKQIDGLYLSTAIKNFAGSFITIFVPIYLLTLGINIQNIAIYYIVGLTTSFLFFIVGLKINSKWGIKKSMSLGIIISIFYYILLNSLSSWQDGYLLVAIISGISGGIYWAGFHIEFSRFCDKNKEASENALMNIFSKVAGAVGPLIGAILISKISFNFVILLSAILLVLSIIPLFSTKNEKAKYRFSIKEMLKSDRRNKALAYTGSGIIGVVGGTFWPIFIYFTLKEVLSLGIIVSITAVVEILFLFIIGKISDKHGKKVLRTGIVTYSASWISRLFFLSPLGIFFNNLYSAFSTSLIDLPFAKIIYSKSKESQDVSNYFLFREFYLWVGRVLILLLVIFTSNIFMTFIISFFVTFLYFNLLKE